MAWKVYGFMEGQDGNPRFKSRGATVYGPLPRKRWVPTKGDKKRRIAVTNAFKVAPFDKDDQARKGIEYARWLAARDGVALPDGSVVACWAHVTLPTGKLQSRISCVTFGTGLPRVRIDIPNWDFVPVEPVMEIDHQYFRDLLAA
jgi:hypothetical protein